MMVGRVCGRDLCDPSGVAGVLRSPQLVQVQLLLHVDDPVLVHVNDLDRDGVGELKAL
jgi:hypothetical protein